MIKTVRKLIDSIKGSRQRYHSRKKRFEAGITGTQLLTRYRLLPDEWKIYTRSRLSVNLPDVISNELLFELIGKLDAGKDGYSLEFYEKFGTILTEIEIVQPFDLQAHSKNKIQVAPVVTETKEVDPDGETPLCKILFDDHAQLFAQKEITKDELLLAMKQIRAFKVLENYKVGRFTSYKVLISTKDGTYMTRLMWMQDNNPLFYQAETDQTLRDTLLKTFLLDMILSQHLME